MIDDDRILEHLSEEDKARIVKKKVRFRTLGCYPLTGAVESDGHHADRHHPGNAADQDFSERQGRVIDHDARPAPWKTRNVRAISKDSAS